MLRRWVIRVLSLALFLLTVFGWAVTHCERVSGWHTGQHSSQLLTIQCDSITFTFYSDPYTGEPAGWVYSHSPLDASDRERFRESVSKLQYHVLGFGFGRLGMGGSSGWVAIVPFWFPTFVSGLFVLLVWRKTRAKPGVESAFPMESTATQAARTD